MYRKSKQQFDKDDGFKERSREAVTTLQAGDPESLAAWNRICAASRIEFEAIYSRLGVHLEVRRQLCSSLFYVPSSRLMSWVPRPWWREIHQSNHAHALMRMNDARTSIYEMWLCDA